MHWQEFDNGKDALDHMVGIATRIRSDQLNIGRKHYALGLAVGVLQAIFCGVNKISAVEFGVASGRGLLDLCKAAAFFQTEFGLDIAVYGLDNAVGLPPPQGYRDLPELWVQGEFGMQDQEKLRAELPPFAELIIGDIAETAAQFSDHLHDENPLGFVAIDVDFYSSTNACLEILQLDPSCYMPMVPMYFDDLMHAQFTYNSWVGESLAIEEFNRANELRKIEANPLFNLGMGWRKLYGCHVLDHPLRNGQLKPRKGFRMMNFRTF